MIKIKPHHYTDFLAGKISVAGHTQIKILDYIGGFGPDFNNPFFDQLTTMGFSGTVFVMPYVNDQIRARYPSFDIRSTSDMHEHQHFKHFRDYNMHPEIDLHNFVCSFNGSVHVGRKFLTAVLHRFGWFDAEFCSKNFTYTAKEIDGHLMDYVKHEYVHYNKFFISDKSKKFFDTIYTFGHVRFDHNNNIYNLESKITKSFIHLVSESIATSYYPYVTEKFLYSVVTRGLFLTYAQPGWHAYLEKYYGFRLYNKLFDYRFDSVTNPVIRLIELISMLSKFSVLSSADWHDLYLLEQDTIEFNYDHYRSRRYLACLDRYQ